MKRAALLVGLLGATVLCAQSQDAKQIWPSSLPSPAAQKQAMSSLFMEHASYFAGSIADPDAMGYGTSTNMPTSVSDKALLGHGLQVLLKKSPKGLELMIANGG